MGRSPRDAPFAAGGGAGVMSKPRWRTAADFLAARGAALALIAFVAVGAVILDDYGVSWDEQWFRIIGRAVVDYVLGDGELRTDHNRYYGVALEAPLILLERLLIDSRAIYLSRHVASHLFFLTGGFFCWLLALRLFGDRRLALFALLLFLLHPRLYAHSFFNSRDIPFLALFMVALYLLQRAFRRDTAGAFALCGLSVGLLVSLRIMGVMLFAAAAALRALDLLQARAPAERRRALATAGAFALAAAATLYAVSPYLWRDPLAIADAVATLVRHPSHIITLFQGEPVRWPWIPPHYLPTWMAITTPPATLLLCLIGIAAVIAHGAARPGELVRNTEARFLFLLLACLLLPIAAVMALRSNLYNGWRHMYFLYAPLCLLAVFGLRRLLAAAPRPWLRRGLYALAAAALAGMAVDIARLHPHQQAYFNFLVDRRTPERLNTRYQVMYWGTEYREGLEYLLDRYPDEPLYVDRTFVWSRNVHRNASILPPAERRRIVIADEAGRAADFFFATNYRHFGRAEPPFGPVLYARRIYHNTVLAVTAVDLSRVDEATADRYRQAYRATVAGEPLFRSEFDLYLDGRTLTYVKDSCRPQDTVHPFRLLAAPVAVDDLPRIRREGGWDPLTFRFGHYGVRFDGRCMIRRILPDYPIRALEIGRLVPGAGALIEATIDLAAAEPSVSRFWQAHQAIAAGDRGEPAARAAFDLYLDGGVLTYHKEPCGAEDVRARFFLHVFPTDAADLSPQGSGHGFDNLDFAYAEHGVLLGGACVAQAPLPDYAIARVRTGQFISGQGQLWRAEFPAPGPGSGPGAVSRR